MSAMDLAEGIRNSEKALDSLKEQRKKSTDRGDRRNFSHQIRVLTRSIKKDKIKLVKLIAKEFKDL